MLLFMLYGWHIGWYRTYLRGWQLTIVAAHSILCYVDIWTHSLLELFLSAKILFCFRCSFSQKISTCITDKCRSKDTSAFIELHNETNPLIPILIETPDYPIRITCYLIIPRICIGNSLLLRPIRSPENNEPPPTAFNVLPQYYSIFKFRIYINICS